MTISTGLLLNPAKEKAPMRTVAFDLFSADEKNYFISSCWRWGKNPEEFRVRAEEEDLPTPPPGTVRREVIVNHLPSGNGRRYGAGHGSKWIVSFQTDLQAGFLQKW